MTKILLTAALALLGSHAFAQSIDAAQSRIGFTLKQFNVPVDGQFRQFSGKVAFDPAKLATSKVELSVPLASVALPGDDAIREIAKPEWFSTAKFPQARLLASQFKALGGDRYQLTGTLTLKGISRPVSGTFTARRQGALLLVDGTLPLSRLAYKVGEGDWEDTDTVADQVVVKYRIALKD